MSQYSRQRAEDIGMKIAPALPIVRILQTLCVAAMLVFVGTVSMEARRSSSSAGRCTTVAPIGDDGLSVPARPQSLQLTQDQKYRASRPGMLKTDGTGSESDSKLLNQVGPGAGVDAAATSRRLLYHRSGSVFNMLPRGTVYSPPGPSRGGNVVGSPPATR